MEIIQPMGWLALRLCEPTLGNRSPIFLFSVARLETILSIPIRAAEKLFSSSTQHQDESQPALQGAQKPVPITRLTTSSASTSRPHL